MSGGVRLRKYGEATTITFELFEVDGVDFRVDAAHASGDTAIMKDEGAEANTTNAFVDEGNGYSLALTATEMEAARIVVYVVDQTATKVWLDRTIEIETYGNASAQHAFDLDTASTAQTGDSFARLGAPAGASVSADIAVIENQTDDIGVAGAGLTAIPTVSADVVSVSGDTTAADNLELMYDGTGYTDDTAPASRLQVSNIGASGGGSINFAPSEDNTGGAIIDGVTFVGTVASGTFADAGPGITSSHSINDTANDIDIVYGYDVGGGRVGTSILINADVDGGTDNLDVEIYNHVTSAWDIVGNIDDNEILTIPIIQAHTGTGSELGKVYVRYDNNNATTPANLEVFECLVSAVNVGQTVGYADGAVWLDTTSSNTNTESFVDGVADNPVSTIAAALTIAGNVNLSRLRVLPGSSFILPSALDGYEVEGKFYDIDLNGQSISETYIAGANVIGGAGTSAVDPIFEGCIFNTAITLIPGVYRGSFVGNPTLTLQAGDYLINNAFDRATGATVSNFDFAAAGSTRVNFHDWKGGLELHNMGDSGADEAIVSGFARVAVNANSSGGTLTTVGFIPVENNGSTTVVEQTLADTYMRQLMDDGTTTFDRTTDSLQEIRDFVGTLNDLSAADINAEILDVLNTDTFAEPSGVPAATTTLVTKLGYLYMALRNQIDVTATKKTFYDDSGSAEWEKDLTDDGTTYSESEGNAI